MMMWSCICALLLLLFAAQIADGSTDCESYRYVYTLQPPEAVTCSPFQRGILNLTCAVAGELVEGIQWYFKPAEGGRTIRLTNNSRITITESEFEGDYSAIITIGNLTDNDAGYYWCQGLIQHEDRTLELSMSDQFHLETEDQYFPFVCPPNKALKSSDVQCAAIVPGPVASSAAHTASPTVALPEHTSTIELLVPSDERTTTDRLAPTRTSPVHTPLATKSPSSKPTMTDNSVTDSTTEQPPSGSETDSTTPPPPEQGSIQLSNIILYAILGLLGCLVLLVFCLSIIISVLCCKKRHRTVDGKEAQYDQFSTESEAPHGTSTLKSLDSYPLGPPPPPPYRLPIHPSHSDTMTSSSSGVYDEIHTIISQYGTQSCVFPLYQEIQVVRVGSSMTDGGILAAGNHGGGEGQDSALGGESSEGDDLSQQDGPSDHPYDLPDQLTSSPPPQEPPGGAVPLRESTTAAPPTRHNTNSSTLSDQLQHGYHSLEQPSVLFEQSDVRSSIADSSDFTNSNLQVTPPPPEQSVVVTSHLTGSSCCGGNEVALDMVEAIAPPVEFVGGGDPAEEEESSSTPLPVIPEHPYHVLEDRREGRITQGEENEGTGDLEVVAPSPHVLHRLSLSEDEGYDRLVGPPHIYHILQKSPSLVRPRVRECSPTSGYHHLDNRVEQETLPQSRVHHHHAPPLPPPPPPSLLPLSDEFVSPSEESSLVSGSELFDDPQYNTSLKRAVGGQRLAVKPHRNSHSGHVTTLERLKIKERAISLSKYRGDYERDPAYMAHKLTDPMTREDSCHTNKLPCNGAVGSNKSASLPDITHTYQSLQTLTRDPLRNYEILKNRQSTSNSSSNSANV